MSERKHWNAILLLAGAAIGLVGFSSAAAGDEQGAGDGASDRVVTAPVLVELERPISRETLAKPSFGIVATRSGTALGYTSGDGMSVAVGYDYVTNETVGFEVATRGGLDSAYAGHEVMVRANWSF